MDWKKYSMSRDNTGLYVKKYSEEECQSLLEQIRMKKKCILAQRDNFFSLLFSYLVRILDLFSRKNIDKHTPTTYSMSQETFPVRKS